MERYRTIVRLHTSRLFSAFIAPDSSNEINVRQGIADRIKEHLEDPRSSLFDEAQDDIFKLMNVNAYKPFLQSNIYTIHIAMNHDQCSFLCYMIIGKFCRAYLWKREGKMNRPKANNGNTKVGEPHTPDIPGRVHHGQTTSLPPLSRAGSNNTTVHGSNAAISSSTTKDNLGAGHASHATFNGHSTSSPHSAVHSSGPTAIVIPVSPPPGAHTTANGHLASPPFVGHVSMPSSPNIPSSPNPLHPPHHPSSSLHHGHSPPNLTVTIAPPSGTTGNGAPSSPIPPSVITAGTTVPSRPGSATGMRSASVAAGGAVMATKHLTVGSLAATRLDSPTSPSVGAGIIAGSLATNAAHHHHNSSSYGITGSGARPLFVNATAATVGAAATVSNTSTLPSLSPAASASSPSASTITAIATTTSPTNLARLSSLPPLPDISRKANVSSSPSIQ